MASVNSFPARNLDPGVYLVSGLILTDSSGDPTNDNDGSVLDADGDALRWPRGIELVDRTATGLYEVTLSDQWHKLVGAVVTPVMLRPHATLIGTVDLNGLTLSALNGLTLKLDGDVGAQYTTTFTTPSSIQDIADQINAGNAGTSVFADIVTDDDGAKYLRVISTTYGGASTLVSDASSTGDGTLGISNSAQTAGKIGAFKVLTQNTKGRQVGYNAAKTIVLLYEDEASAAADLKSGGFYVQLWLRNSKI